MRNVKIIAFSVKSGLIADNTFILHIAEYVDFLISGPNCKIPNMDPFAKEAMNVFKREKYEPCSSITPLTSITNFGNDSVTLLINNDLKSEYLAPWQNDLKVRKSLIKLAAIFIKLALSVLLSANYSIRSKCIS